MSGHQVTRWACFSWLASMLLQNSCAMSAETHLCEFCGSEIIFRTIGGIVTPIHVEKSDCIGRRLYRRDQEGVPHFVKCPKCEGAVIFLRSNGGSVWLDSLGPPWPKHACFDQESRKTPRYQIPQAAENLKHCRYYFAKPLGNLVSGEGFVVFLRGSKKGLNESPKWNPGNQWQIVCPRDQINEISRAIDGVIVFASFEELRLVTLDGAAFDIRKHAPVYYEKPFPKRSE
jgi:hypothetical protein